MAFKYIDFPNELSKSKALVTDLDAISQSIIRLLLTNQGELLDQPSYGASLRKYIYEPFTENTRIFIELEVRRAIEAWEDRVELRSVNVISYQDGLSFTLGLNVYVPEFDAYLVIEPSFTG